MVKEVLLKQFSDCYDKDAWFVAVRNTLEGVTAEQAAWKPDGTDNSIWESLAHISYYNNAYLQRFKGIDYKYEVANNDEPSTRARPIAGKPKPRFDHERMAELLETADEAKFEEIATSQEHRKWRDLIVDMNAHSAHHGGQIVLLRKLQGSWNSGEGVS